MIVMFLCVCCCCWLIADLTVRRDLLSLIAPQSHFKNRRVKTYYVWIDFAIVFMDPPFVSQHYLHYIMFIVWIFHYILINRRPFCPHSQSFFHKFFEGHWWTVIERILWRWLSLHTTGFDGLFLVLLRFFSYCICVNFNLRFYVTFNTEEGPEEDRNVYQLVIF